MAFFASGTPASEVELDIEGADGGGIGGAARGKRDGVATSASCCWDAIAQQVAANSDEATRKQKGERDQKEDGVLHGAAQRLHIQNKSAR